MKIVCGCASQFNVDDPVYHEQSADPEQSEDPPVESFTIPDDFSVPEDNQYNTNISFHKLWK